LAFEKTLRELTVKKEETLGKKEERRHREREKKRL
jgi:hypothetical protein